jgi:hypothetical protein
MAGKIYSQFTNSIVLDSNQPYISSLNAVSVNTLYIRDPIVGSINVASNSPDVSLGDNSSTIANTRFVQSAIYNVTSLPHLSTVGSSGVVTTDRENRRKSKSKTPVSIETLVNEVANVSIDSDEFKLRNTSHLKNQFTLALSGFQYADYNPESDPYSLFFEFTPSVKATYDWSKEFL